MCVSSSGEVHNLLNTRLTSLKTGLQAALKSELANLRTELQKNLQKNLKDQQEKICTHLDDKAIDYEELMLLPNGLYVVRQPDGSMEIL